MKFALLPAVLRAVHVLLLKLVSYRPISARGTADCSQPLPDTSACVRRIGGRGKVRIDPSPILFWLLQSKCLASSGQSVPSVESTPSLVLGAMT